MQQWGSKSKSHQKVWDCSQDGSHKGCLSLSQTALLKWLDQLPSVPVHPQAQILSTGASCQSPYPWGMGEGRNCTRVGFFLAAESLEEKSWLQVGSSCPSPSTSMQVLTWHTRPPFSQGRQHICVAKAFSFFFHSTCRIYSDLAWNWISPATAGPKQVLKAARSSVSYQISAESSIGPHFLLVPARNIGLGSISSSFNSPFKLAILVVAFKKLAPGSLAHGLMENQVDCGGGADS